MWGGGVSADTIFVDDFNSYNNGSLNGQGGWLGHPAYQVLDNLTKEGDKAVHSSSFASPVVIRKSGTLLSDGQITFYVRRFDANQPGVFSFKLKEGVDAKVEVRGNFGGNAGFQYVDGVAASYVNFGVPFNFETWYAVQIQWRSADHAVRYAIDNGIWTDWVVSIAPWAAGLDAVELETTNAIAWDTIQERPIDVSKTPVLIVPGLTGTELKDGNDLLWADLNRMGTDVGDNFLDKLSFNSDLKSSYSSINTSNVINSETFLGARVFDYTESLITDLKSQGYIENENLFTFPYDWRYGVTGKYSDGKTNTDLLAQKIQEILQQTGADEVDVVAHSMGGLIVKQYVANHLNDNHIGKAVFVGVPNTGAPYAAKTLLQGDNLGMFFVSDAEIKKITANMPAMYDLLPTQQYYDAKGSFITTIDKGLAGINPTVKNLTFSETKSFLTDDHNLNELAVSNAENLHTQNFDNFDLRTAGIDLYAIDGCRAGTLGKIVEVKSKTILGQDVISYQKPEMTPGDGTVPLESATNLPVDPDKKFYSLKGEHGKLMSQDGTRQQIVNILSGGNLSVSSDLVTQDISKCELNGKAISVFSPVDIYVTDQNGNKLGLAEDGSLFNEIPNADFQVWGDHKFIYLPTDDGQIYDIKMKGTDMGTYTIKIDDIENSDVVKTQTFNDLPVTSQLTGSIYFGVDGAKDHLEVKQAFDSQTEVVLPSPPEAVIRFDVAAKDVEFSATEPNVIVTDADDMVTFVDQVGDITKLQLSSKSRKKAMQVEIKLLQYNGVDADISKTVLKFAWSYDKQGNLEKLVQQVKSKGDYAITAEFDSKRNTTKVEGKDSSGKIKRVESGLKIINITTNKGDFDWTY